MFAKMHFPETIPSGELDDYLEMGWFRMRQTIFTTNFLCFHNQFYSAIWLRIALENFTPGKKQLELYKQNTGFRTDIQKTGITEQQEALFKKYRRSISFEVAETLNKLLFGNEDHNRYDTYIASVYDGDQLIAAGFFDLGKSSAAGIACMYHPAYKKYSLGKYLIYLKIDYCRKQRLRFFYPGYMAPGYPAFEYKRDIGKDALQWLDLGTKQWLPYSEFTLDAQPLNQMREKLAALKAYLEENSIATTLMYYRFFDVRLDPSYDGIELFDFPVFLYCLPVAGSNIYRFSVYDVRDAKYHVVQCSSIIKIDFHQEDSTIFSSDLLKVDKDLAITANTEEILELLFKIKHQL